MDEQHLFDEELTPEELSERRRKQRIRRAIVIVVVIAMIAALAVPVIVRVVKVSNEPDGIVAQHAFQVRRMIV